MNPNKETFETWNNIASLYQDKFMGVDLYNESYDYICASIQKSGACLLDIGCGPGNITKYLLSKRPDFIIFGIDVAPNMIELARKNNPTATFEVMDTRQIGSLADKYDGIIAGFCLPYLSESEAFKFIQDASQLLNENGLIYLSFVEGDPEKSEYKSGSGGRVFFNYHQLSNLIAQLNDANFGAVKTYKVGFKRSETETEVHTILTAIRLMNN